MRCLQRSAGCSHCAPGLGGGAVGRLASRVLRQLAEPVFVCSGDAALPHDTCVEYQATVAPRSVPTVFDSDRPLLIVQVLLDVA